MNILDSTTGIVRRLTTADLQGIGGGSGGSTIDRELVVTTYSVKTAFTGASVGDTVTCTQVLDVSNASPSTIATVWRNQSTATDLASTPPAANLTFIGTDALSNLVSISTVQGNGGDSPAASDTASASQVAIAKRTNVLLTENNLGGKILAQLIDESTSGTTYICEAALGSPENNPVWRIQRIQVVNGVTRIRWAGTGAFDQAASDRAALTYN